MAFDDGAWQVRARGWRAVASLHARVERAAERAVREHADLSVVEYVLLDVLARQRGHHHLRMSQIARAMALSESAATRLVDRLEDRDLVARYLCADDRRGIYAELTTPGRAALAAAQPAYRTAVKAAIADAEGVAELAPVVAALRPVLAEGEPPPARSDDGDAAAAPSR